MRSNKMPSEAEAKAEAKAGATHSYTVQKYCDLSSIEKQKLTHVGIEEGDEDSTSRLLGLKFGVQDYQMLHFAR